MQVVAGTGSAGGGVQVEAVGGGCWVSRDWMGGVHLAPTLHWAPTLQEAERREGGSRAGPLRSSPQAGKRTSEASCGAGGGAEIGRQ